MDPRGQFCHNPACWAYGRRDEGHVVIHSRAERRYRCRRCAKTFSATTGTGLYRAHEPHDLVVRSVAVLLCVDGLSSYVSQARRVFREAVRAGGPGRPRLVLPPGVLIAQVVKQHAKRRVVGVTRRVVQGTAAAVAARLVVTQGKAEAVI